MRAGNPVGDSAESGFPLPKPVSMHRDYPRSRLWIGWCMPSTGAYHGLVGQTLQKNEATWYGVLRHYDARFDTALRVADRLWSAPVDGSRGSEIDETPYNATPRSTIGTTSAR